MNDRKPNPKIKFVLIEEGKSQRWLPSIKEIIAESKSHDNEGSDTQGHRSIRAAPPQGCGIAIGSASNCTHVAGQKEAQTVTP